MNLRRNVAHAALLFAALYLCSGCASQQLLAIKDRDIRDLRQQVASRQEALVKSLKTLESVRADLGAARYERRELEQEVARSSASIRIQQQSIDRLETQKAKLQEKLRQSEIAYERLGHTYQDIKAVLSNTVTELAQTRRDQVVTNEGPATMEQAEHTRLRRKVDELRSQVIRERAARRAVEMDRAPTTEAPPHEESSPWVWRLTEEPPEVETIEPGTLVVDENDEPKAAGSTSDEPNVLGTAFLWTLGAIPAIGITLLMFVVLVRVMSRPGVGTREVPEESPQIDEYEDDEIDEPRMDEADERDEVVEEELSERSDEEAVTARGEESPVDDGVASEVEEDTESRRTDVVASSSPSPTEESPAETTFIDSLDWLEETAQPPIRRKKYSQDTEAVQLSESGFEESGHRDHSTESLAPAPKPRKPWRRPREMDDGNSDTQMIEKIDEDEIGLTQVLPFLEDEVSDDGDADRAFTETAVLDAADITEARSETPEESRGLEEVATDTQVLPPLLDFEDDSELDEALAATDEQGETDTSPDHEAKTDGELLAELEDLMGEKFEEPVL